MICAAAVSVTCAVLGILLSIVYSTPTGSTIVAADMAAFLIFCLLSWLGVGKRKA